MDEYSQALADAAEEAIPGWAIRQIGRVAESQGIAVEQWHDLAVQAGEEARERIVPQLRDLLEMDIDQQDTTPLAVMRDAVPLLDEVLQRVGAHPVERDDYDKRMFPGDHFGITPANWSDIDERLVDPAIAWGAAKAMAHKQRHQRPTGEG